MTDKHVRVRISSGQEFLLHERIQRAFPDDYVLIEEDSQNSAAEPTETATAVPDKTGGETEGDQG